MQGRAEQDWNPTTLSLQHTHLFLLSRLPESWAQTEARDRDKTGLWGDGAKAYPPSPVLPEH